MIHTTLKRLLDTSDHERVAGYIVEGYEYLGPTVSGVVRLHLHEDYHLDFDQQQLVELDLGSAIAVDTEGNTYNIEFFVTRALQDEDVL